MPYDEQKLHHFETSILTEASLKAEQIEREISEFSSAEIEKARQDEYDKKFEYMQSRIKELQQKYNQIVTKETLDSRRALLEFRLALVNMVFDRARKELEDFANSYAYQDFLVGRISESARDFPCENAMVYLREQDMKYADRIKSVLPGSDVQADKGNKLGGYKIINHEAAILLDESFETSLEKQRPGFYKQCGLAV